MRARGHMLVHALAHLRLLQGCTAPLPAGPPAHAVPAAFAGRALYTSAFSSDLQCADRCLAPAGSAAVPVKHCQAI